MLVNAIVLNPKSQSFDRKTGFRIVMWHGGFSDTFLLRGGCEILAASATICYHSD